MWRLWFIFPPVLTPNTRKEKVTNRNGKGEQETWKRRKHDECIRLLNILFKNAFPECRAHTMSIMKEKAFTWEEERSWIHIRIFVYLATRGRIELKAKALDSRQGRFTLKVGFSPIMICYLGKLILFFHWKRKRIMAFTPSESSNTLLYIFSIAKAIPIVVKVVATQNVLESAIPHFCTHQHHIASYAVVVKSMLIAARIFPYIMGISWNSIFTRNTTRTHTTQKYPSSWVKKPILIAIVSLLQTIMWMVCMLNKRSRPRSTITSQFLLHATRRFDYSHYMFDDY